MKRKFLEKLKKLKNKRAASAAITAVFAALLTTAAITGQQKTDANITNSGAPGSVSVSSIKNFGGGNFESDYQGAYFYILPDQNLNSLSHTKPTMVHHSRAAGRQISVLCVTTIGPRHLHRTVTN